MSHTGRRGGRRGDNNSGTGGGRGGGRGRAPPSSSSQDLTAGVERLAISTAPAEPLDVTARADELVPAPSSKKAYIRPRRPGFGTIGMKCIIRANHFLVQVADRDLHHYDVTISPEVTNRAVCRKIIKQLVELYKDSNLGKLKPVYDGRKSLYTAGKLPFTSQQFNVNITEREREKEYKVNIKFAGKAELHHLQQFLLGKHFDTPQDTIQVLDIVLREFPSQNYTTVARSFFSTKLGDVKDIGDGLECWRGYYQSLRPTQMGLSVNIDISATSFYKAVPVVQFAAEYLNIRDPSRPLIERQRTALKKAIRGLRVEVTHRKDCHRLYKITGITTDPLDRLTFTADAKGGKMRVVDYFREKYNCRLNNVAWPCLVSGSENKPIHLPMEVCKIVEGQRYSKKLSERQVTGILRSTCQRPQQREKSIMDMASANDYDHDVYAKEFGVHVSSAMTAVEARVLPPPILKYHETGKEKICNPRVGAWNMINKRMVNGGKIASWACISFSRIAPDAVERFASSLMLACNTIGMAVNPRPIIPTFYEQRGNIEGALKTLHGQANQALKGGSLQMLLVILPDVTGSYGKIKRVCETELGIISQCCLPKHVQACKGQYMENVAMKINVKVGGRNTVLADALARRIPLVTDIPTIIFGADVTHPPPGEDSSASIAAVVASMDWPEVTKYRGLVSAQTHREEMIKDLYTLTDTAQGDIVPGGMIRELLISFRRSTGHKPHRIIFYRDGVSEGQFSHVLFNEVDAVYQACQSLEDGYLPPITFVVVQKRHHTRLFPEVHGGNKTDKSGNILPGTVVDRKICHPTEYDFYLCSHAGIQGTSRPTHYHVLYDDNNFTPDNLQLLTNSLCYTYARCTRSVSVVPPAYYAHLAAFRARYYVEGDSDGRSGVVGGTRVKAAGVKPLPKIMDNIKDVMFYC